MEEYEGESEDEGEDIIARNSPARSKTSVAGSGEEATVCVCGKWEQMMARMSASHALDLAMIMRQLNRERSFVDLSVR